MIDIKNQDGTTILSINVDDESYVYRELQGENAVYLNFSLPYFVDINTGANIVWRGLKYTLYDKVSVTKKSGYNFEYKATFKAPQEITRSPYFLNIIYSGATDTFGGTFAVSFSLTAKPHEHLQMIIDNLNYRDSGWTIGECVEGVETLVNYDKVKIYDALSLLSTTLETEFEIEGKTISLKKVEYNKTSPLPLSYGKGNGFCPGIGRTNFDNSRPLGIMRVVGGNQNIDASKYGNSTLLLPKSCTLRFDGSKFSREAGFDATRARTYQTDSKGHYIVRDDYDGSNIEEGIFDGSDIYPQRLETIISVETENKEEHWYNIVADTPVSLDYTDLGIAGETPVVVFQSGMLAGREFELETTESGEILNEAVYDSMGVYVGRRFRLIPVEQDGYVMPDEDSGYFPIAGDTFKVFGVALPDVYIEDNATMGGAAWDLYRAAVKSLYTQEDYRFTFTGTLDSVFARKNWLNISGKLLPGGYIYFSDTEIQPEPILIRITAIKEYINTPYRPEITLSNENIAAASIVNTISKMEGDEVLIEKKYRDAVNFTKRSYRDAKETVYMVTQALGEKFDKSVNPISVETMQIIAGDESLQFRFVDENFNKVTDNIEYRSDMRQWAAAESLLQHMTLGVNSISSARSNDDLRLWRLPAYTSAQLEDTEKSYYVYAKVEKEGSDGVFLLSEVPIKMHAENDYYHLLVGIINSEYMGKRSYVSLYGFTEVLPGRITTDMIISPDGKTYFDLVSGKIAGNIEFLLSDGTYKSSKYLTDALNGSTEIAGGLILTQFIGLQAEGETKAFVNGNPELNFGGFLDKTAFAAGVTNFLSPNNADALVNIKHDGIDSRVGLFRVDKDAIAVTGDVGSRVIIISNKTVDSVSTAITTPYDAIEGTAGSALQIDFRSLSDVVNNSGVLIISCNKKDTLHGIYGLKTMDIPPGNYDFALGQIPAVQLSYHIPWMDITGHNNSYYANLHISATIKLYVLLNDKVIAESDTETDSLNLTYSELGDRPITQEDSVIIYPPNLDLDSIAVPSLKDVRIALKYEVAYNASYMIYPYDLHGGLDIRLQAVNTDNSSSYAFKISPRGDILILGKDGIKKISYGGGVTKTDFKITDSDFILPKT